MQALGRPQISKTGDDDGISRNAQLRAPRQRFPRAAGSEGSFHVVRNLDDLDLSWRFAHRLARQPRGLRVVNDHGPARFGRRRSSG